MFLCAIGLVSGLISACAAPEPLATGYVEGEYVRVAPVAVAQVESLAVARGSRFVKGDVLGEMERRDAVIAQGQAEAALAAARATLENLREGARPEEIRVIEASLVSARASLAEYERSLARVTALADKGSAAQSAREDAATAVSVAQAKVAEIEADLAVARLPARAQQIAGAEANVRAAEEALAAARWALEKRTLVAPADGVVSDVIRLPGEIAGPSAPVLTILPDGAVKLRLYVPEAQIAGLAPGRALAVECDGCAEGIRARVSYIADGPEFTPPVIYSLQNRQKLVYMVEARPEGAVALKPGQIVSVGLIEAGK